jgi:hypothetical protein
VLHATHGEAQAVLVHQPEDKQHFACPLVRGHVRHGLVRPRTQRDQIIGPLGFYMSAQGSLIIYVAIIWYYAHYMNNLDKEYGVHEGELD